MPRYLACSYIDGIFAEGGGGDLLPKLRFDTRTALLIARRNGLYRAVRGLLLLRNDVPAALEASEEVADAKEAIARAPQAAQRDLWLQFVRFRSSGAAKLTVEYLKGVCGASGGVLAFQDVATFVAEEERGSAEVQEALALHNEAGSAKLRLLQRQFDGFGKRMQARKQELDRVRAQRKNAVPPGETCGICGGLLSKKPRRGAPYGGALPPVVAYIGSMYHTACAAKAHAQHMVIEERMRWDSLLETLAQAPAKGAPVKPAQSPAALQQQQVMMQRRQALLKELSDLLTKNGDPATSLKQLDRLEVLYGEREPELQHELLRLPTLG